MLEFLIGQKATLDALDRYGDSPLEEATANGSLEAVQLLKSRGAHQIRGTEAQRQKAIREDIERDIERMGRDRGR